VSGWALFAPVVGAALLGGSSAGALGVLVVGLRMPFLAVATAHAAMAGAIFGQLAGLPPLPSGFAGALVGALGLGWLLRRRDLDQNAALGTLFSLALGLSFLGIGLADSPRGELLGLLWGSLLFVTRGQLVLMAVAAALLAALLVLLARELELLLFSRELAAQLMPEAAVFTAVLLVAAAVIAVNLETVGGLLLYSLVTNPAVAALRLARTVRGCVLLAALLGALCALGGFAAAFLLDLPVGASIVLVSSVPVGLALARGWWRR
jgi:manganese/iron transport system permease protein